MAEPAEFVLDPRTGLSAQADIRATLKQVWAVHPEVPEDIRLEVSIASIEIGTNIIQYFGGGQPIRIRMQIWLMPTEIHITFTDDGSAATAIDLTTLREVS